MELKIKVLDTRIVGAELAIDVECTQNSSRGIAVLKLYGPSTKKQNVVMVTKCKGSDVGNIFCDKMINNKEIRNFTGYNLCQWGI